MNLFIAWFKLEHSSLFSTQAAIVFAKTSGDLSNEQRIKLLYSGQLKYTHTAIYQKTKICFGFKLFLLKPTKVMDIFTETFALK